MTNVPVELDRAGRAARARVGGQNRICSTFFLAQLRCGSGTKALGQRWVSSKTVVTAPRSTLIWAPQRTFGHTNLVMTRCGCLGRGRRRAIGARAAQAAGAGPGWSPARTGSCRECAGSSAGTAVRYRALLCAIEHECMSVAESGRARRTGADGLGGRAVAPASDTAPQQPAAARLRRARAAWSASWVLSGRSSYLPLN